tara:strand:- start:710 stop:1495 length:786 start_codon:yes stop_codon:yes gene_type:complete
VRGLDPEANERVVPLTAEEIVERYRATERSRASAAESGVVFTYQRDIRITDFDSEGEVERLQTRRFKSFTDNRVPVLVLRDGKEPTPEQVVKEHRNISKTKLKFLGTQAKAGTGGEKKNEADARLIVRQIEKYGEQFEPHLLGTESVEGRPAYVLQFFVKPGKTFNDPIVNLVLHHLIIKVWIDREEFHLSKLEAELANPLYAIGGLAAKLERFKVVALQKRLTSRVWADGEVRAEAAGRVLFDPFTVRFESKSSAFKPLK